MSVGRVGNNELTRKLMFHIKSQMSEQEKLFEQISSNKRILRPSDDPTGTSKALVLNDQLNRLNQYDNVVDSTEVATNTAAVALDNAISTWKRVSEISISAADGTKTAQDRIGMAEELEQLLQHLVQVANTTNGGRQVFSGSKTDVPAFRVETDPNTGRITGVYYQGDDTVKEVKTKDYGSTPINLLGSNGGNPDVPGTFVDSTRDVNLFNTLMQLRDKLLNNDVIGLSGPGGLIQKVSDGAQNLTSAQTRLGGIQEVLNIDRNRLTEQNSSVEQALSQVQDADTAKLILELNNVQNVYEAALAAGGRIMQTGLLNFL